MTGALSPINALAEGDELWGCMAASIYRANRGSGIIHAVDTSYTELQVTEKEAGANMSVDVWPGYCSINGTVYYLGARTNYPVAASHATLDRYDLIIFDQSAGVPVVLTGIAASSPFVPTIPDDLDIPLAIVFVLHGATVIATAACYDIRSSVAFSQGTGEVRLVGRHKFPINNALDDAGRGSCFSVDSITYVIAGTLSLPSTFFSQFLPGGGVVPKLNGSTLAAYLSYSRDRSGNSTYYVELYDETDAESIFIETVTVEAGFPVAVRSTALTVGPGNQIVAGHRYSVRTRVAVTGTTARIYDAVLDIYATSI